MAVRAKPTMGVVTMRGPEGALAEQCPKITQAGVVAFEVVEPWLCGKDASGKTVLLLPAADVVSASVEPKE